MFLDRMDKLDTYYASDFIPKEIWNRAVVKQRPSAAVVESQRQKQRRKGRA